MKKIVLLSGDPKLLKDMTQWLGEVTEEIVVEPIADLETFYARYCSEAVPEESESKAGTDSDVSSDGTATPKKASTPEETELQVGEKAQRHFPARLVIADLETVMTDDLDLVEWVVQAKAAMAEFGYSLPELPTRFFLLGQGEQGTPLDKFRHDAVDDLMQKPLDKSVFLQKVEIHLADPGSSVHPSFLFMQKTETLVEMGKDTFIESVSEFGFTIRNPAPLAAGVFAKVYSALFGTGANAAIIGRVYNSEKNTPAVGGYTCFLTYHGINSDQLASARKIIRAEKIPTDKSPRQRVRFDSPIKNIAVIDLNADSRATIRDAIEVNFANAQVFEFPSYSSFLRFCQNRMPKLNEPVAPVVEGAEGGESKPIVYAELSLGGSKQLTINIDAVTGNLLSYSPQPKRGTLILGLDPVEFKEKPEGWLSIFGETQKEDITEYLLYLRSGQTGSLFVIGRLGELGFVRLRIHGKMIRTGDGEGESIAEIDLTELTEEEWTQAHEQIVVDQEFGTIDAIFIDGSFFADDPSPSIEGLLELLRRTGLVPNREALTILILAEEKSRLRPSSFRLKTIQDFIYKPLDRKMILSKLAIQIRGLIQKTESVDLVFRRAGQTGRVTKEVMMEELSEFGLQIRHETPLKERSFLRFFSSIFLDETGQGLLGRCQYSTKDESGTYYHCFFSFFGATDAQLKHIRTWIRGDYASRKEKSGS